MEAKKKKRSAALLVLLAQYERLQSRYMLLLRNLREESRMRRRLAALALLRSRRQIYLRTGTEWEAMLNLDDHAFTRQFRLQKPQFEFLLAKLQEGGLRSDHTQGAPPIPVPKKLLLFLCFMAKRGGFRALSHRFHISQSSVYRVTHQVLALMAALGPTFIAWPDAAKKEAAAAAFRRACGLERVIGVVDGCHMRVQRPSQRGEDYRNNRAYHSVLLQGIVDQDGRFIDVFAGPPGMMSDAAVLRESHFYSEWEEKMGEYLLLGDRAYADQSFPFVITPPRGEEALLRGLSIAESSFGKLKCRWRRLWNLQTTRRDRVVLIVLAACCLHNLAAGTSHPCPHRPEDCPRREDDNV